MGIVCYQLCKEKNTYLYLCAYTQTPSGIRQSNEYQLWSGANWVDRARNGRNTFSVYFCAFCFLNSAPPANVFPTQILKSIIWES